MNRNPRQNTDSARDFRSSKIGKVTAWVFLGLFVLGVSLSAARTYIKYSVPQTTYDWSKRGHSDFHYGTYYPALAFRDGANPYDPKMLEQYPVTAPARVAPPINFILHLPFTMFELKIADVIFFSYNTLLMVVLGYCMVRMTRGEIEFGWWMVACCALAYSRPGHITLFTGYFTLELVLGTIIALHFARSQPLLSGIGMLVASGKPTYVLPLILVLLAKRCYRAAGIGILLCTLAGVAGLGWIASETGIEPLFQGIKAGQEFFHADETELPVNSWTRIDVLGTVAKVLYWQPKDDVYLISMFVLMLIPCVIIFQLSKFERDDGIQSLSCMLGMLLMLVTIYHQGYDCLLLAVTWFGLTFFPKVGMPMIPLVAKRILAILLAVPLFNYVSTKMFRDAVHLRQTDWLWQAITMVNTICLVAALTILLACAVHVIVRQAIREDFGKPAISPH